MTVPGWLTSVRVDHFTRRLQMMENLGFFMIVAMLPPMG